MTSSPAPARPWILPVIVFAQFCCTSLWFASNGIMNELVANFGLVEGALGHLTSAVQFGFIAGTLVFALLTIADRFSPSRVFLISALLGALFNLGAVWGDHSMGSLFGLRFCTGFFLAGIYPVGMKIAADHFDKHLGKSLGFLVGALVLGTAFPHLLNGFAENIPWRTILFTTSALAVLGGVLMVLLVPDGPFRKTSVRVDLSAFWKVFKVKEFRAAAFGYFGHMWELYAFWAFVPVILKAYLAMHPAADLNIPAWSFTIIGVGGLACVLGGYFSLRSGPRRVASIALLLSGLCCLLSPLMFQVESSGAFLAFLIFWGMVVVADSPLFSTLVAKHAPAESKGTALTIVNCIGFSITILTIQLVSGLSDQLDSSLLYVVLAVGPVLGLLGLGMRRR